MPIKTSIPLVIPLADAPRWGRALVGGKAYNLGQLLEAGLTTPEGFCLTTAAFQAFLDTTDPDRRFRSELERASSASPDTLHSAVTCLQHHLRAAPLPQEIVDSVRKACRPDNSSPPFAVRSSATTEDQQSTSAAGQHLTSLNVSGLAGLLDAIRACWISLFDEHAVLYRVRLAPPPSQAAMAVVVQPFIPAVSSGVAFSLHPLTGQTDRIVIEACHGLGTTLVSGQVEPDRIVLDKASLREIERHRGLKQLHAVPKPDGGVSLTPTPEDQRHSPCLSPDQSRELGSLILRAERHFGAPLDLEWALHAGRILLLQARPITALSRPTSPSTAATQPHRPPTNARPDVWTQANAIENFPDVVTPLSWSILERIIQLCLGPIVKRLGARPLERRFAARIAGRAYLNLSVFEELLEGTPPALRINLTLALGGHPPDSHPDLGVTPAFPGWRYALRQNTPVLRWMIPALPRQGRLIAEWIGRLEDPRVQVDPVACDDPTLAKLPDELVGIACQGSADRIGAAGAWMAATAVAGSTLLFQCTRRWLSDPHGAIANRLLSGSPDMSSTQPAIDLWNLAAWTREHPALRSALEAAPDFAALSTQVLSLPEGREFLRRWDALLVQHGHQARSGMDIASPRWSEMPDYVLGQVRTFASMDPALGPLQTQARMDRQRRELQQNLRTLLPNPLKRALLRVLARTAQRGMTQRENVKQAGVCMIGLVRKAALEIGRRLADRNILATPDDVFFLELEELAPALLTGPPPADLRARLLARKEDHRHCLQITPPTVIVGSPVCDTASNAPPPPPATRFQGLGVSPGIAVGKARIILNADHHERVLPGEILVAPFTDPGWAAHFIAAAGLVVDIGGLLSHGSIVAREFGLPAVVNVGPATRQIRTGQTLRVDGNQGTVEVLNGDTA